MKTKSNVNKKMKIERLNSVGRIFKKTRINQNTYIIIDTTERTGENKSLSNLFRCLKQKTTSKIGSASSTPHQEFLNRARRITPLLQAYITPKAYDP